MFVGVVVVWFGYALTYFGFESLKGPGVGLLDLVVPGRFKGHANPGLSKPAPTPAVLGQSGFGAGGKVGGGAGGGGGGSW